MKKTGGARTSATRASGTSPREPWRKWVMTLLALGFALLVITLLSKQNKILEEAVVDLQNAAQGSEQEEITEYPLSFNLPAGWSMNEGCVMSEGGKERGVRCGTGIAGVETMDDVPVVDSDIAVDSEAIFIKNTNKIPLFGGIAPFEAVASAYQMEGVVEITVERLNDEEMLTLSDTYIVSLGNGFYNGVVCDVVENPECTMYGNSPYAYYFIGETGTYRFTWMQNGVEDSVITEVILSAEEK